MTILVLEIEYLVLRDFSLNSKYPGDNVQDHDQNADKNAKIFCHFWNSELYYWRGWRNSITNFSCFVGISL